MKVVMNPKLEFFGEGAGSYRGSIKNKKHRSIISEVLSQP
jgi:hypothetical protein